MNEGTNEERMRRMGDATAEHRCQMMARNLIANLHWPTVMDHVGALRETNPGAGAIVAGAGPLSLPNLTRGGERLVYATQSSALALTRRGIRAGVIVCIEGLDVSEQLRAAIDAHAGCVVVLDMTAHPKCFDVAADSDCRALWSLSWSPYYGAVYDAFDVVPLGGGGSALTTAAALALRLHHSVHLVGVEGIVDGSGVIYAPGSPWEGLRYTLDDATGEAVFTEHPDREALHRAGGVPPIPRKRRLMKSSDGRWVKPEVMTQCMALSKMRELYGRTRDMTTDPIAAAELNWERRDTSDVVERTRLEVDGDTSVDIEHGYGDSSRADLARGIITQHADRQLHFAQQFEHGGLLLTDGPTIPSMLAAPDLIMARNAGLTLRDRLRVQYAAYAEAARLAKRLVEESRQNLQP